MALTETTRIHSVDVQANANQDVIVQTETTISRDGEEVTRTYHRRVISGKDPIKDEDPWVQGIVRAARRK